MQHLIASLRVALATMSVCVLGYVALLRAAALALAPEASAGSLLRASDGRVIGSRLVAQGFVREEYVWPRPSAVDYDASAAGGSNLASTHPELRRRAEEQIARHGASAKRPLPPELATASGSGLDPHLSESAALYQVERVARARGAAPELVEALVRELSTAPARWLDREPIVNVLELNLALDARLAMR